MGRCRPQWADLQQQVGESQAAYRERLLGLGLHFSLGLQPKAKAAAIQEAAAAAAECREAGLVLPAPPKEAATAAAPGAEAAALATQLTLAQGGQAPGLPTALSAGFFAVRCLHPISCTASPADTSISPALGTIDMLSMCRLQALFQDLQRTTEQLVKDKLQEQRVSILTVLKHRLANLNSLYSVC